MGFSQNPTELDTVSLIGEKIKLYSSISLLKNLNVVEKSLGWNEKITTFVPTEKKDIGRIIETLKYQTSNIGGTKGLDYLPFIVNIYSIDSLSGMPDKPLIKDRLVAKKTERGKWVIVNIDSYNIKMPKEGVFVSLEILNREAYPSLFIKANIKSMGLVTISCVPGIKAYNYDEHYIRKSYGTEMRYDQLVNGVEKKMWYRQDYHYLMDLELKD